MKVLNPLTLPLHDIQGWIIRGYHLPFSMHLSLSFTDRITAKSWLKTIVPEVTTGVQWPNGYKPTSTLNLALTAAGLEILGVPDADLALFPFEFRQGMASRATSLGDTGPSAPENWEFGYPNQTIHALVTLHATTHDVREQRLEMLRASYHQGVKEKYVQPAAFLPGEVEHFGFRDGLSQPAIEGTGLPMFPGDGVPLPDGSWRGIKAGEFILGYPDEAGVISSLPAALIRNGTFLVLRKIEQDVVGFRHYLQETSRRLYGSSIPANLERLAAKIMGRWRSGAPLELAPDSDKPELRIDWEKINDFRYRQDPVGLVCPRGAHIRRANPRDALDDQDVAVFRHRIVRRGMPYGHWLPIGGTDESSDRGLVFIAFNSDISRQFEFVQIAWMNQGNFAGLGPNDRDPITGPNDLTPSGSFLIPGAIPPFLYNVPRFTKTRGGGYFFVPGIAALKLLTNN